MKRIHIINVLLFVTTLSSCQNKENSDEKNITKEKPECEILYNKYLEKFSSREKDSALYYIDKCIKCDPSKKDNKYIKAQLLTSMKDYKSAILIFDELKLGVDDPTLIMQKGTLMLKINDVNSEKNLKECYTEFKKIESPTSSNLIYKIALDNYFLGKEFSIKEIEKFKLTYKDKPYETENIKAVESLIKNENKENVLYKLFNIRD